MFHLTSIIVIVLTFFGYTSTPVSTAEVPHVQATIQAYGSDPRLTDTAVETGAEDVQPDHRRPDFFKPIIIQIATTKPMPEEPIAPAFEVPLPTTAVPEAPVPEAQIPTILSVSNTSKHPLYSDCSSNPTASFFVTVRDQNGNAMEGVTVSYTGTAPNNTGGTFTSLASGNDFHYTIKGIDEGNVNLVFFVKPTDSTELVKSFDLTVSKAPAERPAWCD